MLRLVLLISFAALQYAFVVVPSAVRIPCSTTTTTTTTATTFHEKLSLSASSASDDDEIRRRRGQTPKEQMQSRIAGNQRPPTVQELEVMDQMIDKLANAKPYELPPAVTRAFRVISSPQFFLRIATRQDTAASKEEKEKLAALAANLVSTLEAVVSTTEDRMDERAKDVERVVKAAAEPDSGEFLVPLTPERLEAMYTELRKIDPLDLDETFLNTLDAWMNKSHEDGMDLMVGILQKVLQMYAGLVIQRAREQKSTTGDDTTVSPEANKVFEQLLQTDADAWDRVLLMSGTDVSQVKSVVQKNMEIIVLSLDAGSMNQRVQAEYLKEMVKRIEAIESR